MLKNRAQEVRLMKLSKRAQMIKPSPTLAMTAKAKALNARGIDVISFGAYQRGSHRCPAAGFHQIYAGRRHR
jgi:hypothetical protein